MTPELMAQRHGCITASNFAKVVEGGIRAKKTYLEQLRRERAQPFDASTWRDTHSGPTDWGNQWEEEAARRFAFINGYVLERPVSFQQHADYPEIGCSPDGLIKRISATGMWAGLEIKCPFDAPVHVSYRIHGLPDRYRAQVQGSMWVTGLDKWWFVSFDPRAIDEQGQVVGSLYQECIARDHAYIQKLERKILKFRELLLSDGQPQEFDPESDEIPQLF